MAQSSHLQTEEPNMWRQVINYTFTSKYKTGDWVVCYDEQVNEMLAQVKEGAKCMNSIAGTGKDIEQPLQHWRKVEKADDNDEAGSDALREYAAENQEDIFVYCTGCEEETIGQGFCQWVENERVLFPATVASQVLNIVTISEEKRIEIVHIKRNLTKSEEIRRSIREASLELDAEQQNPEAQEDTQQETVKAKEKIERITLPILQEAIVRSISRYIVVTQNNIDVSKVNTQSLWERHATIYTDGSYENPGTKEARSGCGW